MTEKYTCIDLIKIIPTPVTFKAYAAIVFALKLQFLSVCLGAELLKKMYIEDHRIRWQC